MARNGTYGDHLTLQAAADLFNVEFIVVSSLGPDATTVISPLNSVPISSFYIGHFAEGDGEHYVALRNDAIWQECCMEERAAEPEVLPNSENNAPHEPSYSLFETCTVTSEVAAEESYVQEKIDEVTLDQESQASTLPPTSPILPNQCGSSFVGSEAVLNQDILEEIIKKTLAVFPYMRQSLRVVSRFFRETVDKQPPPKVYIPELNNIADIRRVSMRKIMLLKGKASGAVIRLREIINHVKWASAWISFIAAGNGWFGVLSIFWKNQKK